MDISETFKPNASLAYHNGYVVWHNDTQKLIIRASQNTFNVHYRTLIRILHLRQKYEVLISTIKCQSNCQKYPNKSYFYPKFDNKS